VRGLVLTMRWLTLLAMLAVVAGGGAIFAWHALGEAEKGARLSTLMIVRRSLVESARTERRYPRELNEIAADAEFSASVDFDNLEYLASGQSYVEGADRILFRERTAHRYGWTRGWYEIRQEGWTFHRSDGPHTASDSEPSAGRRQ